jgi:hypothetical protein
MPYFGREEIVQADDQQYDEVAVPEWAPAGDPEPDKWILKLKGMTGLQRDHFEASMAPRGNSRKPNMENFRARLVAQCAVDVDGNRLFNSGDLKMLGSKSAKALSRVYDKCQEMNGLSDADVEELVEDFGDTPNDPSTSDSPSPLDGHQSTRDLDESVHSN